MVVPCYNEEETLKDSFIQLNIYLQGLIEKEVLDSSSKICLVNDGSLDNTEKIIDELAASYNSVYYVKLARNYGHQNAILAGLLENINKFDCYITIDADLQDDINAIQPMVESFINGNSVVYGVRNDRTSDTWFKRFTAQSFYQLIRKLGVPIVYNHADFRLIDNIVLRSLAQFTESNLFMRGIIPLIGYKSEIVYYKRLERKAGESKYPLKKMIRFAWNGVTSFSTFPMKLVLWFGIFNFLISIIIGIYAIYSVLIGRTVSGWASTIIPITFFSGSNMMAIGLIGEYVGKIYEEVKGRPRYIVKETNHE